MPEVVSLRWHGPDVFELFLDNDGLDYRVGDCTLLIHEDQVTARPYSFSSHPSQPVLGFLIRLVPAGGLTPWLAKRRPGDWVETSSPFGWMYPEEAAARGDRLVFAATGTGLAPFLSYLRGPANPPPEALYYGLRRLDQAADLEWLSRRAPIHLALSGPLGAQPKPLAQPAGPAGRPFIAPRNPPLGTGPAGAPGRPGLPLAGFTPGRIDAFLPSVPHGADFRYYLCGHEAMIRTWTESLLQRGVSADRIHGEVFFPETTRLP